MLEAKYGKRILVHYFDHLGLKDSDNAAEIEGAVDDIVETAVNEAKRQIIEALGGKIDKRTDVQIAIGEFMREIRNRTNKFDGQDEWDYLATDKARNTWVVWEGGEDSSAARVSEDPHVAMLADALNVYDWGFHRTWEPKEGG
jgi:hypothetical protein